MLAGLLISHSAGGTFLAWSIYYLSGAESYFRAGLDAMSPVCDDPINLREKNAHNFWPNFPRTKPDFDLYYNKLRARDDLNLLFWHENKEYGQDDINDKLRDLDKILFVDIDRNSKKFFASLEGRVFDKKYIDPNKLDANWQEQHLAFLREFFSESLTEFGSIESPWDHREFLALNLDWDAHDVISNHYDRSRFDHFYINNMDVWLRFDQILPDVFGYMGLEIDQSRLGQWSQVYSRWKMLHVNRINFCLYFDAMVDAIVRNINMDLTRFDLDVVQEGALLRSLMRKHGLTLRAYGLERFTNTQELHALLESNFHAP